MPSKRTAFERVNTPDKVWERGRRTDDGCLVWLGACTPFGYGQMRCSGQTRSVHRLSWEITNGTIPEGLFVLHRCDNPPCFEPSHLFLGTHADNMADMGRKGRQWLQHSENVKRGADFVKPPGWIRRGEASRLATLTEADVREIRRLYAEGMTQVAIAPLFNTTQTNVSLIVRRKNWQHVE